jgi:tRNA-splicing endonuclease subunit Sen54
MISARTTLMPSLYELTALFDVLPERPLPPPRQRRPPLGKPTSDVPKIAPSEPTRTLLCRLFPWGFTPDATPARKPNPFVALKACKKNVVVAAVDAGSISFFRFGQGAFEEWPMT